MGTFYRHEYQKFLNEIVGRIFNENLSDAQIAAEVAKGFIPNKDDPYGTHGIEHKGVKLDDVPYEEYTSNSWRNRSTSYTGLGQKGEMMSIREYIKYKVDQRLDDKISRREVINYFNNGVSDALKKHRSYDILFWIIEFVYVKKIFGLQERH